MAAGGSYFLENLFFLGTAIGTFFILSWIVLRVIAGFFHKCNDSVMAQLCLHAGMRYNYTDDDKLYHALLKVLESYMGIDYRNRGVTLTSKQLQNGKEDYEFVSPPGYGIHHIQYKTHWIRIERKQQPELVCDKVPFESITLSTYKWNIQILYDLLTEAKESQRKHDEKKTAFYSISCSDWSSFGEPKRRRCLESVITADGVKERLLKDVREFLDSEDWYLVRGIPYRRGYLLHGPPGTGKSSLIRAIAGEIAYDICILSLSAKDLTDDELNRLMNCTPDKCIILLEDVDAAFKSRENNGPEVNHLAYEGTGSSKVTFRGLLNALDGVASTEGRIICITTNYIDKLDPALLRPGRCDVRLLIDYPTANQITKIFKRFYPKAGDDKADTFLHILMGMDMKISMATIQGLFLMFKNDPDDAIQHAEEYLNNEYFSGSGDNYEEIEDTNGNPNNPSQESGDKKDK